MPPERRLHVLQVSASDHRGGAQRVGWDLFAAYRAIGHDSKLAVGRKRSLDPDVFELAYRPKPNSLGGAFATCERILTPMAGRAPGAGSLRKRCLELQRGWRTPFDRWLGREDFNFPASRQLLQMTDKDILHCHNLHGGYFDLRMLPELTRKTPVVLTLHDAWLLSGHCAHSFDCMRWRDGCGDCPDLSIYPRIARDATAFNWRRKREIFARSRLYVATPCRWLMRRVEESILSSAVVEAQVIPNGVDLKVFHPPEDRSAAKSRLGVDTACRMVIFAADGIRRNVFKDYDTFRAAMAKLGARWSGAPLLFLALGDDGPSEAVGQAQLKFVPFKDDASDVALYFAAADVCVHAARAETFALTIIESFACGVPVIASAVGGIPEIIESGTTGFLVAPGAADEMAARIEALLRDDDLRRKMGELAAATVRRRFDINDQVSAYLDWYQSIVDSRRELQ
jgi:glycosyltransferase involved in cell wall biosynthesis